MNTSIVLLSGPLSVGKTAVAEVLSQQFLFKKISSSGHLRALAQARGLADTRATLQQLGDTLDEETDFAWLIDDVAAVQIVDDPDQTNWFVDAVRKPEQVKLFRNKFSNVLHVHLTARDDTLRSRFLSRRRPGDEVDASGAYESCIAHPNEKSARALGTIADVVIDLDNVSPTEAGIAIVGQLEGLS